LSPPLSLAVGDAPAVVLRWRQLALDAGTPAQCHVALIDRLFVLPYYRRRRIARMTVLNALVDVLDQGGKTGVSYSRVSVFLPEEQRILPMLNVLVGLGFQPFGAKRADDPTGMWGAQPGRAFLEIALPAGNVVALLQAAAASNESVRPQQPRS
jgi:hypothetical protein